jgi:hypothetical protein
LTTALTTVLLLCAEDEDAATPLGASALPAPFNIRPFVQIHNEKLKVRGRCSMLQALHVCASHDRQLWLPWVCYPDAMHTSSM